MSYHFANSHDRIELLRNKNDDIQAISEVVYGNTRAFEIIISKYQGYIFHIAFSFLSDREEALDATQEIFLRVFFGLRKFNTSRSFRPWLVTVALNYLRSEYKKSLRQKTRVLGLCTENPSSNIDPCESAVFADEAARLRYCISRLPWGIQKTIVLYYYHDLPVKEIAEIMHIGTENVKSRLHRGRSKLRSIYRKMQPNRGNNGIQL